MLSLNAIPTDLEKLHSKILFYALRDCIPYAVFNSDYIFRFNIAEIR